jgi:uncharacterized protein (TIGR02466 family)
MIHDLAHPKEAQALWPSYVFSYKYRDWPYDKKQLVDCIYNEVSLQKKDIDSDIALGVKNNLKEGKFDFLEKTDQYPILTKLNKFISEAIADVVTHALPSQDPRLALPNSIKTVRPVIFESWYHVTNNGGIHGAHCHPGASWAAIFYVQSSECSMKTNNGVNRFFNSGSSQGPGDLGSFWWNSDSLYGVDPEEGTLVLFPAWLWHDASPYTGKEDRIVVACNSVVIGTDGHGHQGIR